VSMQQREFEIRIGPDGQVSLEVKGYKGRRCVEVAKLFEKVVGEISSQRLTREFYDPEEQVRHNVEQRH
jgi:hypothetical protein